MNQLSAAERAKVVRLLCEGMSIRATCRALKVGKNTVTRLLCALGPACAAYQDDHLRNLNSISAVGAMRSGRSSWLQREHVHAGTQSRRAQQYLVLDGSRFGF